MNLRWLLLVSVVLGTRLTHAGIVWVEEAYPAAAAIQVLHGKAIYRDFVFDKPPLTPLLYLLWGAHDGWMLRVAGALYVVLCCWVLYRFARELWSEAEGWFAAALAAFFLTMDWPAATMALAPDLLMFAPHTAAVWLAWRGRPVAAGVMAGVATVIHTKGMFVLLACGLWQPSLAFRMVAGFAIPFAVQTGWLAATGSLTAYFDQVWRWGWRYSADTFIGDPWIEAVRRTAGWAWFHAALLVGFAHYLWRDRDEKRWRMLLWFGLSLVGVAGGWRFFPRYYFQLLPVAILAASRGMVLFGRRPRIALALLLLAVPLVRFGARYPRLALEGDVSWGDTAMNRDSRQTAAMIRAQATPEDTLLVWGYRPDLFVYTRMPAASRFLDSQPLTGVLADRHLFDARPTFPDLARLNRSQLLKTQPDWIVDGLGPYHPALAIERYPDLRDWLTGYTRVGQTAGSIVYKRVKL